MTAPLPTNSALVARDALGEDWWVLTGSGRKVAAWTVAALRARQAERGEVTVSADDLREVLDELQVHLLFPEEHDDLARLRAALPAGGAE